jgi:hypothetical protein
MSKRFNITGVCFPELHYMADVLRLSDTDALALARYLFNTFSGREVLEDVADVALASLAP